LFVLDKEKRERLIQLGRFIRYNRTIKSLSIAHIEKKHSFDKALWSKIENGKIPSMPKPELLMQISEILDCNCIELYKLLGYIKDSDIYKYISESHRVREKNSDRKSMKP
jgi:transcriptional regulator with XRE-family HTH domain